MARKTKDKQADIPKGRYAEALERIFASQDGEILKEILDHGVSIWVYHYAGTQKLHDVAFREGQRDYAKRLLELGGAIPVRSEAYNNPKLAVPSTITKDMLIFDYLSPAISEDTDTEDNDNG